MKYKLKKINKIRNQKGGQEKDINEEKEPLLKENNNEPIVGEKSKETEEKYTFKESDEEVLKKLGGTGESIVEHYLILIGNIIMMLIRNAWSSKYIIFLIIISGIIAYLLLFGSSYIQGTVSKTSQDQTELEKKILEKQIEDGIPEAKMQLEYQNKWLNIIKNPGEYLATIISNSYNTLSQGHTEALGYSFNIMNTLNHNIQSIREFMFYIRNAARRAYIDAQTKLYNTYSRIVFLYKSIVVIITDVINFMYAAVSALQSASCLLGSTWNGPIGGVARFFCFSGETEVKMRDNKEKRIKDIKVGDELKGNNIVISIMELKSDKNNMFIYNGIEVSGSHKVLENNKWIEIKESKESKKIEWDEKKNVYCLNTSKGKINIKNKIFKDFKETINMNLLHKYNKYYLNLLNNEIIKEIRDGKDYYQPGIIDVGDNKIRMNNGEMKDIKEIEVNELLEGKNKVLGKIKSKELIDIYKIGKKYLSGKTVIKLKNNYRLVEEIEEKEYITSREEEIYHLIVSEGEYKIDGIIIKDYFIYKRGHEKITEIIEDYFCKSEGI